MQTNIKDIKLQNNNINNVGLNWIKCIFIKLFNVFYSFITNFLLPCALISNILLTLFALINKIYSNVLMLILCFISLFVIRIVCKKTL